MATVINRQTLKDLHPEIITAIQGIHKMGPEIEKELFIDNEPVVGLCHQRGYFLVWKWNDGAVIYLNYLMDHVIRDVATKQIGRSVMEVTIYDSFIEYESARVSKLSSVSPKDQTGLNLN